jgi:hypothetical protein
MVSRPEGSARSGQDAAGLPERAAFSAVNLSLIVLDASKPVVHS